MQETMVRAFLPSGLRSSAAIRWGTLTLLAAGSIILTAIAFEHLGGYVVCPLCLQQRYAYYAGVPLLGSALVLLGIGSTRIAAVVFAAVALAFAVNAGLGVYHAGIEWKWWDGPATCSGALLPLGSADGGLLGALETRVARCDEAPWQFAGLSFAGWNAVLSLLLAAGAARAAVGNRQ